MLNAGNTLSSKIYVVRQFYIHTKCKYTARQYSGAPLIWTLLGPEKVAGLVRCPLFRLLT